MSSVGGSGSSSRQDEVARRNREDYQSKESELVKKHHKEIKRLSEAHYSELERLKEVHDRQMRALQDSARKAITQRDQRHQHDIDSMRSLHKKQLQSQTEGMLKREELLTSINKGEKDQALIQMQSRLDHLNKEYERSIREKEEVFRQNLELNREAQKKGLEDQREKLEKTHREELKFLREDRDRKVAQLKNEYSSYRKFAHREIENHKIKGITDQQRAADQMINAVKEEQIDRAISEDLLREGFKDGLSREREKFESALEKERDVYMSGKQALESEVKGRVGSRIDRLEAQNRALEAEKIREGVRLNKAKQREIANVRDSFTKNIEDLQRQRDEAVHSSNEKNAKDIHHLSKKHERIMFDTNREFQTKMETQNFLHKESMDVIQSALTGRADQAQRNADRRVKGIIEHTELAKQRINEKSVETAESLRRNHADEIRSLRFQFEKEKNDAINRIKEMAQQREVGHQEQMAQLKNQHQKEILTYQDEMQKLKKSADENLKRTVEELQRAHKLSLEQQEFRHKDKLQSLEVDHSNRLKTLNRRHDEKMDQLSVAMKKKS